MLVMFSDEYSKQVIMANRSVGVNMLQSGRMEVSLHICGKLQNSLYMLSVNESSQPLQNLLSMQSEIPYAHNMIFY